MTKQQIISVVAFLLLFLVLFFAFDTKSKNKVAPSNSGSLDNTSVDITNELNSAKSKLSQDSLMVINNFESNLVAASTDSLKSEVFKKISGWWYRQKEYALAGYYAEKVAEIEKVDYAWAIAGTTFSVGAKSDNESTRKYCIEKSKKAFENAISLSPNNIAHKVNLALCFADNPPTDNPMKGIQMLLELSKEYPDENIVQITLARLAVKTGQYEKAINRLLKILEKTPDDANANCLLVEIYSNQGDNDKAMAYQKKCK